MTTLYARDLSLKEVHRLLGLQRQYSSTFTPPLSLEPLTGFEQQELEQIRNDLDRYLIEGEISGGQVKFLAIAPLLRLAGFYHSPIKIALEENIGRIHVEDEDTNITGRFDILAINKEHQIIDDAYFWLLVIESKNGEIAPSAGLAQLLTYAYKSLERQEGVWGLTTNGNLYQFVYIQQGNSLIYQLMPLLNLMEPEPSRQLFQVLKAICKL